MEPISNQEEDKLFCDIRALIEETRQRVAVSVNSEMTLMYWRIGERINREELGGKRAAYGGQVVAKLARKLSAEYGKSYDRKSLNKMMRFATVFPNLEIVAPLVRQLSWSHFLQLIPIEDELKREFYMTMAIDQRWSKRELKAKIDGSLYERTAIAKKF